MKRNRPPGKHDTTGREKPADDSVDCYKAENTKTMLSEYKQREAGKNKDLMARI